MPLQPLPRECIPCPVNANTRDESVRDERILHESGFVAAMDGNLSVGLDDVRIPITWMGAARQR